MQNNTLESSKKELILGLNSFNKPGEVIGKDAWIKLITYLMFMKKGSYPSCPTMGIGIQQYDYQFMDKVITDLQMDIQDQISTYLPDIPLESVSIDSSEINGQMILLITLTFIDNGLTDNAVVATIVAPNIINFEVAM